MMLMIQIDSWNLDLMVHHSFLCYAGKGEALFLLYYILIFEFRLWVGVVLSSLDASIVATIYPQIGTEFKR
jgi:hypothetical protein